MALIGSEKKLVDDIIKALQSKVGPNKMSSKMDEADDNGNIKSKTSAISSGKGTVSVSTLKNPKTGAGISVNNTTGAEAMAALIADRVINHILTNFELASKKRYDQLEMDYNNLLANLQIAAAAALPNPMTAAVGAGLQAAVIAGGGPARAAITTTLKMTEKAKARGGELY